MNFVRGSIVGHPAPAPIFAVGSALRSLCQSCSPGCCPVPLQTVTADVIPIRVQDERRNRPENPGDPCGAARGRQDALETRSDQAPRGMSLLYNEFQ